MSWRTGRSRSMPRDGADALTEDQAGAVVAEGAALADDEADGGTDRS